MEKKTLLIIDRSPVLMDITKKIFERDGYSVRCAGGFAGAQEQLLAFMPDGIILENDLPDGSGFELCRELRESIAAPIMFISDNKEDELSALQAEANDFLKKPFDYDIMKARVSVMLNTKVSLMVKPGEDQDFEPREMIDEPVKPDRRQPVTGTKDFAGPEKKKRAKPYSVLFVVAVACIVFVLAGIGIFNVLKDNAGLTNITGESVPLAAPLLPDGNAVPYGGDAVETAEGPGYLIASYGGIDIHAGDLNVQMNLLNPKTNSCYFTFEVTIGEPGETLYASDLVKPGMCIDNFILSNALEKGEYKAVLIIRAYEADSLTAMDEAKVDFTITVM